MSRRSHACAAVMIAILTVAGLSLAVTACGKKSVSTYHYSQSPTATASSSMSPTASPSESATSVAGGQTVLAVASGPSANALSVVTPAGAFKMLVGPKGGGIREIAWSSDGTHIAYTQARSFSNYSGTLKIYDVTTGSVWQVLFGGAVPHDVVGYAWVSPTKLIVSAFTTAGNTYHANGTLYTVDVATSVVKPVIDNTGKTLFGVDPTASTDGMAIAFIHWGGVSGGGIAESLELLAADTLSVSTVAHSTSPTEYDGDAFDFPVISPDGSMIATSSTGGDIGFSMTVYRVDGTKAFNHNALTWPTRPAWNPMIPDRLAYAAGPESTLVDRLYIESPTARTTALSLKGRSIADPAWSADGNNVAYAVFGMTGNNGNLYVTASSAGSTPQLLLKNASWPAWGSANIPGL